MTISCIITDDEPFARKGLEGYVSNIEFLHLKGVCESAMQLIAILKQQPVDLIFLDIEMPYLTGIDFLKTLIHPPKIILTTAYEKYAVVGFELDILDYLLKPISFERFLKSANKAFAYFDSQISSHPQQYIFVKTENKLEKINLSEIFFVEALENYVAIQTVEKRIIAHLPLKSVQEKLSSDAFIQTHKSYLVSLDKINSIEGNILHVGKFQVPVSRYQKEEVMEKIVNKRLIKRS